jgi:hypothetical protein
MSMDKYDLAARITLADLDGFHGKLSAKQQREVFDAVLFGKKTVRISCDGQGTVEVLFPCWEGTHTSYSIKILTFETLCTMQQAEA